MSSAGRSERLGGEHDFYPTPTWAVHRLLDRIGVELEPGVWLEPCAGYGAIIRAAARHPSTAGRVTWRAVEIQSELESLLTASLCQASALDPPWIGDFLRMELDPAFASSCTVVLTNPPFALAEDFLAHCRETLPRATIVFLLRSTFIGGEERLSWLGEQLPDIYQLPNRPSFRDGVASRNDSAEYSWMVWRPLPPGMARRRCNMEVLEATPLEVRKRDKAESRALLAGVEFVERNEQLGLGDFG